MKIAVIGASGFIGYQVTKEALRKGHQVVGIFRRNAIPLEPNLELNKLTIFDEDIFKDTIKDSDVLIGCYNPGYYHVAQKERYLEGYSLIIKLAKELKKKLIIVIGATSLIQYDGELVKDGLVYPKPWIKALEGVDLVYQQFKNQTDNLLTFVSPPAEVFDGTLTKKYKYGKDHLLYDRDERSRISVQDLAHAIIQEAEENKYLNQRFTVAYQD